MYKNYFSVRFAFLVCLIAWTVIMLGAYTRLKDAGLGCPDWPVCYGQITVPQTSQQLKEAKLAYPNQPVEVAKAWPEMLHRYVVGVLGGLIFVLALVNYQKRRQDKTLFILSLATLGVIIFQAILGKWTVTMHLFPLVVMGHLLGGFALLTLLWLIFLRLNEFGKKLSHSDIFLEKWGILGLVLIVLQIILGGWTSSNYAALACPDFPLCRGNLIPLLDFKQAFNFLMPINQNFQGGVLSEPARMTIQVAHRFGALIVFLYVSWFGARCLSAKTSAIRCLGVTLLTILIAQLILGILNIELMLPVFVAVAHNGIAAILLLCIVTLLYYLYVGSNFDKINHRHRLVNNKILPHKETKRFSKRM